MVSQSSYVYFARPSSSWPEVHDLCAAADAEGQRLQGPGLAEERGGRGGGWSGGRTWGRAWGWWGDERERCGPSRCPRLHSALPCPVCVDICLFQVFREAHLNHFLTVW